MANANAFGDAMEIDVYDYGSGTGGCIYGSPPISGDTKVAIHRQPDVQVDAFSLELSAPVLTGAESSKEERGHRSKKRGLRAPKKHADPQPTIHALSTVSSANKSSSQIRCL